MRGDYEVRVNGAVLDNFERGMLQLTMDAAVNSFDVEYVTDTKADDATAAIMVEGDTVEVALDGGNGFETILEGFVETVTDDDDPERFKTVASGATKATDLVPTSATHKHWSNATITTIAEDLCKPYGVVVTVVGSPGAPFASFAVQQGESPYDVISRAAAKRGFLVYSVVGDLVLARASADPPASTLARGDGKLIRSGITRSWFSRMSEYRFAGQVSETDNNFGKSAAQVKAVILDKTITRFRPLRIQHETGSGVDVQTQATMERNRRAGQGETVTALVEGWLADTGKIWRPNTTVKFSNPRLAVDATLLVTTAQFQLGAKERRQTTLTLARPEAYDQGNYPVVTRSMSWV